MCGFMKMLEMKIYFQTFGQRLIDRSVQDWSLKLHNSGKDRHYRYIMPNFGLVRYIKFDLPLKLRISLSKLRCSAHNLLVETGRHSSLYYENRICRLSNLNKIEDEFHFVMECLFYSDIRDNHLPTLLKEVCCQQLSFFNFLC